MSHLHWESCKEALMKQLTVLTPKSLPAAGTFFFLDAPQVIFCSLFLPLDLPGGQPTGGIVFRSTGREVFSGGLLYDLQQQGLQGLRAELTHLSTQIGECSNLTQIKSSLSCGNLGQVTVFGPSSISPLPTKLLHIQHPKPENGFVSRP